MRKAEYPQRTCRRPVQGDHQNYSCELFDLHAGPCASYSVPRTVEARDAWEKANPGSERLSEFDDPFGDVKP